MKISLRLSNLQDLVVACMAVDLDAEAVQVLAGQAFAEPLVETVVDMKIQ